MLHVVEIFILQEKTENAKMLTFLSDNLCVTSVVSLLGRVIYKLQGLQTVKVFRFSQI